MFRTKEYAILELNSFFRLNTNWKTELRKKRINAVIKSSMHFHVLASLLLFWHNCNAFGYHIDHHNRTPTGIALHSFQLEVQLWLNLQSRQQATQTSKQHATNRTLLLSHNFCVHCVCKVTFFLRCLAVFQLMLCTNKNVTHPGANVVALCILCMPCNRIALCGCALCACLMERRRSRAPTTTTWMARTIFSLFHPRLGTKPAGTQVFCECCTLCILITCSAP